MQILTKRFISARFVKIYKYKLYNSIFIFKRFVGCNILEEIHCTHS